MFGGNANPAEEKGAGSSLRLRDSVETWWGGDATDKAGDVVDSLKNIGNDAEDAAAVVEIGLWEWNSRTGSRPGRSPLSGFTRTLAALGRAAWISACVKERVRVAIGVASAGEVSSARSLLGCN